MSKLTILLFVFYIAFYNQLFAIIHPKEVEIVLQQTPKNRKELEKAIAYFQKPTDAEKLKALYFLISNMDMHYSANYYWADKYNKRVDFNEFYYPNFEESLKAFDQIKKRNPIHAVKTKYFDMDTITGNQLIENINRSFDVWKQKWGKNLPFDVFCEYILPYRISIEPLTDWRGIFQSRFESITTPLLKESELVACVALNRYLNGCFSNIYGKETRKEPLPLLSPLQALFRAKGYCEDFATLGVCVMRSQGIPCTIDMVTNWGTSTDRHTWLVMFDQKLKPHPFEASKNIDSFKIKREPTKVIRFTFSKQKSTLAMQIPEKQIPEGFLRMKNYIDVTKEYWTTKDLEFTLFPTKEPQKIVYACVYNGGSWQIAWWGKINNNKVVFNSLSRGVVYLPMYFINNKLVPASYPKVLGYKTEESLVPDTASTRSVTIMQKENYLIFRNNKKYKLFYWNNAWVSLGEQTVKYGTKTLVFKNTPRNVLLVLIPEYSERKERPFVITDKGDRLWW